jgi:hypothetical protein
VTVHINRLVVDSTAARTALCDLGELNPTDKAAYHNYPGLHRHAYFPIYDLLFSSRRRTPIVVGEIGIFENMSMRCWRGYFDHARLYGFDFCEHRLAHAKTDALADTTYGHIDVQLASSISTGLHQVSAPFDILIEDTTHQLADQIRVVNAATPYMALNGLLIVEDIFITADENAYIDGLRAVSKYYDVATFITSRHELLYSDGWNNDKLLALQRNDTPFVGVSGDMFLNIITPCTRPENLARIAASINIPRDRYRWIVVFDADTVPDGVPDVCEAYAIKNSASCYGNAQRNHALNLIDRGHVYFNDDDTLLHPKLWETVCHISAELISFSQELPDKTVRSGCKLTASNIDTHQLIIDRGLVGDTRWSLSDYAADGYFAQECDGKFPKRHVVLPDVLSIYNELRRA